MTNKNKIILDKINLHWGELLNSGIFKDRSYDIDGRKMYDIEHRVNNGALEVDVLFDPERAGSMGISYIEYILTNLDSIEETSFITGIQKTSSSSNNLDKMFSRFNDPHTYIKNIISGSNCLIEEGHKPPSKNSEEKSILTLKINLDMETSESINLIKNSLREARLTSNLRSLANNSEKQQGDIKEINHILVDDNKERSSKSLGNENDKKIVLKFLESRLKKHSINNSNLNDKFCDFVDVDAEDKAIKDNLLKHVQSRNLLNGRRAFNSSIVISFNITSSNFSNDYSLLYTELKEVLDGRVAVAPAPSANSERHLIGTEFTMRVNGSYARLAGDIKRNAPEEYKDLLNDLNIQR